MRDAYSGFEKQKIVVLGISYDSVESQRKFRDKHRLPFTLLSDRDHTVGKAYGVDKKLYAARKTFIIDEAGKIIKIHDKVSVTTHGEDVLEFLSSLENPEE